MPAFAASAESAPSHITTVVHADVKTGRLVRSVAVASQPVQSRQANAVPEGASIGDLVDRIASEQGVEAPLVHSVIQAESNYNPSAVSPKGALGVMQLIPSAARRFGVANVFNVADNIQGGVRYLRFLLDYYNNDYVRAIAAYNAGEAAVDKYKGIPPYAETQNYVYTVARNLKTARAKQFAPAAVPAEPAKQAGAIVAYTGSDGKTYYRTP